MCRSIAAARGAAQWHPWVGRLSRSFREAARRPPLAEMLLQEGGHEEVSGSQREHAETDPIDFSLLRDMDSRLALNRTGNMQ
jgi:hypothetical protein